MIVFWFIKNRRRRKGYSAKINFRKGYDKSSERNKSKKGEEHNNNTQEGEKINDNINDHSNERTKDNQGEGYTLFQQIQQIKSCNLYLRKIMKIFVIH